MRRSSLPVFRARRALAVAGVLSLGGGLLLLGTSAQPVQAAATARAHIPSDRALSAKWAALVRNERNAARSPAAKKQFEAQVRHLDAASHSSTTVTGPQMYDPTTGGVYPASSVTVTQTKSLVNQEVQVSWTNFTPSSQQVYNNQNVSYPVMVTECKGTSPSTPADCYGAENGGVTSTSGAFGPMNDAYATTGLASGQDGGTGLTDILINTSQENSFLGCDQSHPCSLAIVPAQGGVATVSPPDCSDHTADGGPSGNATGGIAFNSSDWACAWAKKIVVPLSFARNPNDCPIGEVQHPAFSAAGSPMSARAIESWLAALCAGSHGMYFNYDSTIAEPQALSDLAAKQTDIAFTTRSANAQPGTSTGTKKYLYAPVAVTAASIVYWFDNPVTGLPVTNIRLNQRLLLKLLTQSYAYENDGCPPAFPEQFGCDTGVDHNWFNLFQDPDFTTLNPEYAGTSPQVYPPTDSAIEIPTVQSGNSDMTWTYTSWITANKQAKQFLTGGYDPWGMHLNTYFSTAQYPTNSFISQDPYPIISHYYNPVFPLSLAAQDQAENWPPADMAVKDPLNGNYDRFSPEVPGQRALIALVDQGDAAAFLFPTAALPNGSCTYTNPVNIAAKCNFVQPTTAGMLAALQSMTGDGQGTKLVNFASTNKDAYPLTMVVYAVVPTDRTSHTKAAAIARFLDFAAGAGQTSGVQPGQLPPGFAPLPANLRAQTRRDAYDVLHQTGASAPSKSSNPGSGNSGSSSGGSSSAKSPGAVALPSVSPSPGATGNGVSLVNVADVHPASISRYILPALLILGGLAALAGSSSLIGSSSTPISARLRRVSQGSKAWGRTARSRLGLRRGK